jgi:YidC/Oxa1 family membrane protein insertase
MDRKTIISLLVVTGAFLLFTSDPWHKMVRKAFHLPDPPAATATVGSDSAGISAKQSTSDTSTPSIGPSRVQASQASGSTAVQAKADSTATSASEADSLARLASRKILVRTPDLQVVVSGKGGRIEALQLRSVERRGGGHPWILPEDRGGALALQVADEDLADAPFSVQGTDRDTVDLVGNDSLALHMTWIRGGHAVRRTYVFRANRPSIGLRLQTVGWDHPAVKLSWNAGLLQIDPPAAKIAFGPQHYNNLVWKDADDVNSHTDDKPLSASGSLSWVGLRTQYALAAVDFPGPPREGDLSAERLKGVDGGAENSYGWSFRWHPDSSEQLELAVTPLDVKALESWGVGYEKVLFTGYAWFFRADIWFPHLCLFVLWLLQFLYRLVPNYGVAIILLTLVARSAVLPLTLRQVRQSKRMAEIMPKLKPQIEAAKEKYKNDSRKVQEETMRLYAEHGINPMAQMAGCFPLVFQMPVFISLYQVLGRAIELRGQPFFWWIHDLSRPDVVAESLKIPFLFPSGLTILPIVMGASLFGLNKLTIKDPQQAAMVWVMPVMMLVFSGSMPSGLVLYWTVSNFFSMGQTWLVNPSPAPAVAAPSVNGKKKK